MKIALLSDIHANVFAFQAVLEDLAKYEVSKILICGDLVGYYYWPSEVLDLCMDDSRILAIKGNHESQFLAAFQSPRTMRKMVSRYGTSYQLTKNVLKSNQVEWLNSLPERLDLSFGTTSMTLVHGSLTSQSKYVYPTETLEGLTNCLSKATYTVYGHTHYPLIFNTNGHYLLNPGSVGQPRDGCAAASYFVVEPEKHMILPRRIIFPTEPIIESVLSRDPDLPFLTKFTRVGSL